MGTEVDASPRINIFTHLYLQTHLGTTLSTEAPGTRVGTDGENTETPSLYMYVALLVQGRRVPPHQPPTPHRPLHLSKPATPFPSPHTAPQPASPPHTPAHAWSCCVLRRRRLTRKERVTSGCSERHRHSAHRGDALDASLTVTWRGGERTGGVNLSSTPQRRGLPSVLKIHATLPPPTFLTAWRAAGGGRRLSLHRSESFKEPVLEAGRCGRGAEQWQGWGYGGGPGAVGGSRGWVGQGWGVVGLGN